MIVVNIDNARLAGYNLIVENESLWMTLSFKYETDEGIYFIDFPKVALPVDLSGNSFLIKMTQSATPFIDLLINGSGKFILCGDSENETLPYEIKRIKDKPKRMTLEEIEEELGYKVELVDKK